MNFVHLNVHTGYSLQSGACRFEELVKKAKSFGQTALAITDSGALYGAVDFFDICKREGVKPIIGCEVSVCDGSRLVPQRRDSLPYKLTLLCRNETGYKNLCRIISEQRPNGAAGEYITDFESVSEHSEGLIALSGSVNGEVQRLLAANFNDDAEKAAKRYQKAFGEDFFLEISNHGLIDEMRMCAKVTAFSKKTGIRAVPVNNVYYVEKADSGVQQILSCIGQNKRLSDENSRTLPTGEFYLKSTGEMNEIFEEDDLAVTAEIAEKCNFEFEFGNTKLPRFTQEGVSDNEKFLRDMCRNGAVKRYGEITDEIQKRLEYELGVIVKMGFTDYFLIVWDYVHYAKQNGIPVGPGRGSGAASICAYCLGITDIDPLRYNLLFERFLNPERVSMPDFDIDFCTERRDEVIEYVKHRYGADHVAQIAAFDTLKAKAALRDAGRVMGISQRTVDAAAKSVEFETLKECLEYGALKNLCKEDSETKRLVDAALKIEGFPRHTTIHAAGVVITREPAEEYVPLQYEDGGYVAQYTMTALERLGLLKMDFLGLKNLTIIRNACEIIKKRDPEFNIDTIDENDPEVFKMLGSGGTIGVFQFESDGMTKMLTQLKPSSIEDLTAAISLYRPGPMSSIPTYIENRLKKPEEIKYKHPLLKNILGVTYGCIVYQEQVMQICRDLGGYSYGRADLVRRAMAKKKHDVMESERGAFIHGSIGTGGNCGAEANGVPENTANEIFDEMAGFASYAFNKAHAAAYATVAYQTAYLRCHYYAEYMAALITGQPEKLPDYIADLAAHNNPMLPPDVNKSRAEFTVEDGKVRFGLAAIRNLGDNFARDIVRERGENGEFKSAAELVTRMAAYNNSRRYLEALIKSGAMDIFPQNRRELLDNIDPLLDYAEREFNRKESGQLDLFGEEDGGSEFVFKKSENFSRIQCLNMEREFLGAYISGHPADAYLDYALDDCIFAADLPRVNVGARVSFIAMVTSCNPHVDKKGGLMAFVRLEDSTGEAECVMFSDLCANAGRPVVGEVYSITGKVTSRNDRKSISALDVRRAEVLNKRGVKTVFVNFTSEEDGRIPEALKLLSEFPGVNAARLCFADSRSVKVPGGDIRGVRVCTALIQKLSKLMGAENVKVMQ